MDKVNRDTHTHIHSHVFVFWFTVFLKPDLCRLKPAGEPPSPRAAHAAAAVGTMVVFQVFYMIRPFNCQLALSTHT